jgi:hypothetical protein
MPEIGTSGSMSGDGKRSVAEWLKLPRPSSTLPKRTNRAGLTMSVDRVQPEVAFRSRQDTGHSADFQRAGLLVLLKSG